MHESFEVKCWTHALGVALAGARGQGRQFGRRRPQGAGGLTRRAGGQIFPGVTATGVFTPASRADVLENADISPNEVVGREILQQGEIHVADERRLESGIGCACRIE